MPAPRQPDARANALIAAYELAGYVRVEPAILQPAEPFLDLSGEDIRRRMFLIADAANTELCLRPDLTIPVACDYLASAAAGKPAKSCYLGPVFRDLGRALGRTDASRHRILWPHRHRSGRRRDHRARARSDRPLRA
jgi:ATP phosphoribosyltransferase regulatory subunit